MFISKCCTYISLLFSRFCSEDSHTEMLFKSSVCFGFWLKSNEISNKNNTKNPSYSNPLQYCLTDICSLLVLVPGCPQPNPQQLSLYPLTVSGGWHRSGWQRTRQILTLQECVWGRKRWRQSCCVKVPIASWQGAPFLMQCLQRWAAPWSGCTRTETGLVSS